MPSIQVANLTKTYRGAPSPALAGVTFSLEPGEVCGVIGPNGAGKTTLIGCLLGFLFPETGTVTLDGRPPDDLTVRRETGYLPERLVMDRWMTGSDFIGYHHALTGLPNAARKGDVAAALDRVGLAGAAARRMVRDYSRGMLQRLGLAQALLAKPRYLFLDEPTSGMDPSGVILFRMLIEEQRQRGSTIVLNSHQLDQVERVCTRVVFVKGGRVEAMETLQAGSQLVRELRVRLLGGAPAETIVRIGALPLPEGTKFDRAEGGELIFTVPTDEAAAALIRALVASDFPVIEAYPGDGRLERLFRDPGAGGGS